MAADPSISQGSADDAIVRIPCVASCRHVPPGRRKEFVADVACQADIRIRRAPRADFAVSALLASSGGRSRVAVLTDGTAHYAPIQPRLGADLSLRAFTMILSDPANAYRLRLPRIGALPGVKDIRTLPARVVVDDGASKARAHARALAEGWLLIGDVVHQRVRPPCRAVRFMRHDHLGRFSVEGRASPELPAGAVFLRIGPDEEPGPYADVLSALGRSPAAGKPNRILPGDAPPTFGLAELAEDVRACLPLAIDAFGLSKRPSGEIAALADLGRHARDPSSSPGESTRAMVEALPAVGIPGVADAAAALFAERLGRLS